MNENNDSFYPINMMFEFIHHPEHATNRDYFTSCIFGEEL